MIRGATILSMLAGAILAVAVFALKYEVQDLEAEYVQLNRSIDRERQAIHVLTAEWSHLNEPSRLRTLAKTHLGLEPVGVDRLGEIGAIPVRATDDAPADSEPASPGIDLDGIAQVLTAVANDAVTHADLPEPAPPKPVSETVPEVTGSIEPDDPFLSIGGTIADLKSEGAGR